MNSSLDIMSGNSTMKGRLCSFLVTCRNSPGTPFTHTTKPCNDPKNIWQPGTYFIPDDLKDTFWSIYNPAIFEGVVPTLMEFPKEVFPLHVDLDFKYSTDHGLKKIYDKATLHTMVRLHQDAIRSAVDPDCFHEKMLYCIVLQKPKPRPEENFIKDGLHLHFPFFICDAWTQDTHIYNQVLKEMIDQDVLKSKRTGLDPSKVLDRDVGRKPWLLYGSYNYKSSHSKPYLYHRWDDIPLELQYGHAFDEHLNEIPMSKVFEDEMVGRDGPLRLYMPEFLSILGYTEPTPLAHGIAQRRHAELEKRKKRLKSTRAQRRRKIEDILADIKLIEEADFMSMLSPDRAQQHDSKMEVGWCLFCITEGMPEGLELWKTFCRQAEDYDEVKCEDRWCKMNVRGMTMGTLRHWARTDSPDRYNEWRQMDVSNHIMDVICEPKITEGAVARVAVALYRDRFLCSDITHNRWYEYYGHRWIELDSAHTVYNTLNDDLRFLFMTHRKRFRDRRGSLQDQYDELDETDRKSERGKELKIELAQADLYVKGCTKAMEFLNQEPALKKTIRMMANRLLDEKFELQKDRNKYLMGAENGILDLKQGRLRNGRPDDKVTMSVGYDILEIESNPDALAFWDDFYCKIYPNENRRNYAKAAHALTMLGGNKYKNIYMLSGQKDSGKSKMILALEKAFGKSELGYSGTLPPQSFTNHTNMKRAGGPSPEEMRLINKRFVPANEVTGVINRGFIKLWTGNDSSFRRNLHDRRGNDNPPLCTIYIQCNDPPKMPGDDEAAFDRMKLIDHESKFVLNNQLKKFPVPDTEAERIKLKRWHADPKMDEKLEEYSPYLLSYLLKVYIECKGKLVEPYEVVMSNNAYMADNDLYQQFIEDVWVKAKPEEDPNTFSTKAKAMYTEFQEWYRQYYRSSKTELVDLRLFIKEMSKAGRMGLYTDDSPYGYDRVHKTFVGWYTRTDDPEDQPGVFDQQLMV